MKRIGIIGATGFIGRALAAELHARGNHVIGYSRSSPTKQQGVNEWRQTHSSDKAWDFTSLDVIVNLAGERVDQRWTDANKEKFHSSRVCLSDDIARVLRAMEQKPKVWINASAVGYYGNTGEKICDESSPLGEGYLAELCGEWEAVAADVDGVRIAHPRVGIVLGKGGMAWDRVKMIFSLGIGGNLGNGKQWMPWIHIDDAVGAIIHAIDTPTLRGPFNLVAPQSVRNSEFTKLLGKHLKRPAFMSVPPFALRLVVGEFSSAVLASQHIKPSVLTGSGYQFRHAYLDQALADLLQN